MSNDVPSASDASGAQADAARRITRANLLLSALLFIGLALAHITTHSQSALAQGIDSLADALTALGLLYVITIANKPADHDHVAGHGPAEPIAALVLAVLTGVMGTEVIRSAITALVAGQVPELPTGLVVLFCLKFVAKAIVMFICRAHARTSPALRALLVDARNDLLTSLLAVLGYVLAREGYFAWDAWLAVPVGLWVIVSGFLLARENIGLLMGERAPSERHDSLRTLVESSPHVISCHDVIARHHGTHLDVVVHIIVDPSLALRVAHDIGEAVRQRLLGEPDIVVAHVHLDVEDDSNDHPGPGLSD